MEHRITKATATTSAAAAIAVATLAILVACSGPDRPGNSGLDAAPDGSSSTLDAGDSALDALPGDGAHDGPSSSGDAFTPDAGQPSDGSLATFSNFAGINQPGGSNPRQYQFGWSREDVDWPTAQPNGSPGAGGPFQWDSFDAEIQANINAGFRTLLVLDYSPPWATGGQANASPTNVSDWTNFVTAAVHRYSAAPYGVKFFQIWNEPGNNGNPPFWVGTDDEFVDNVYNPAADAVHAACPTCKVVFGGWPGAFGDTELIGLLNYHNAIGHTDVVDVHYWTDPTGWASLNTAFPGMPMWQTEVGWDTTPHFLSTLYTQSLYWALSPEGGDWQHSTDPDKFKLFWFALCCDARNIEVDSGTPSENGIELQNIASIMSPGALGIYTDYTGGPASSLPTPNNMGFRVGKNVVIAMIGSGPQTISARGFSAAPTSVVMVDDDGNSISVAHSFAGGTVTANFTLPGNPALLTISP